MDQAEHDRLVDLSRVIDNILACDLFDPLPDNIMIYTGAINRRLELHAMGSGSKCRSLGFIIPGHPTEQQWNDTRAEKLLGVYYDLHNYGKRSG